MFGGGRGALVAHAPAEREDVHPGRDRQRPVGVAQVMHAIDRQLPRAVAAAALLAQALRAGLHQVQPLLKRHELSPDVLLVGRRAGLRAERQAGRVPALRGDLRLAGLVLAVLAEDLDPVVAEPHRAVRARRLALLALALLDLTAHADLAPIEVQVLAPQADRLAEPQAALHVDVVGRGVAVRADLAGLPGAEQLQQRGDLRLLHGPDLVVLGVGQLHALARVRRDAGGAEGCAHQREGVAHGVGVERAVRVVLARQAQPPQLGALLGGHVLRSVERQPVVLQLAARERRDADQQRHERRKGEGDAQAQPLWQPVGRRAVGVEVRAVERHRDHQRHAEQRADPARAAQPAAGVGLVPDDRPGRGIDQQGHGQRRADLVPGRAAEQRQRGGHVYERHADHERRDYAEGPLLPRDHRALGVAGARSPTRRSCVTGWKCEASFPHWTGAPRFGAACYASAHIGSAEPWNVVGLVSDRRGVRMTPTVEALYEPAQQPSPEGRRRLAQHLVDPAATPRPEQSLGERLRTIRAQIVASGAPLLDEAALQAERADRRGER